MTHTTDPKNKTQGAPQNTAHGSKSLKEYSGSDRVVSSVELAEEFRSLPRPAKVETGFGRLDQMLDGVEGGELVVVLGYPGEGKSALLTTITKRMAENNTPTAWFSLEMGARMLLDRMQAGGTMPLFYLPRQAKERTLKWISERLQEAVEKYGVRAVFIENLKDIHDMLEFGTNSSIRLGLIVSFLRDLGILYDIPVFLAHHPTLESARERGELSKADARGSGEIIDTAAIVLGVWRTKRGDMDPKWRPKQDFTEFDNWGKVKILKNRRTGKLGWILVEHIEHLFREIDTDYEQ